MAADGAAAVEILRAELARAKVQARCSNAAAEKASAELKAEQAARHQDKEKMCTMAHELRMWLATVNFLRRKMKPKRLNLTRPYERRERSGLNPEQLVRRFGKLGRLWLASPFCYRLSSVIRTMLSLTKYGVLWMSSWTCRRVLPMQRGITKRELDMQRRRFFWSQFGASKRLLLLNEQMSQWAELHRVSGAAMKDVIIRLWPTEPVSNSYFSLV